ncbi:MAG: NPCBM/NEW2 domain-containing protein [Johnsonella sp.]|nr:NPCBM/NEW2 domain-containing protein [Johnsonella sp.]
MKRIIGVLVTAASIASMSLTAFAGNWVSDAKGWWFDKGDNSWPASQWMWIDGNNDGRAECYYFDQQGYCLMNTKTPDGYSVDKSGAWVVNGSVQTKQVSQGNKNQGTQSSGKNPIYLFNTDPIEKSLVWFQGGELTSVEGESWSNVLEITPASLQGLGFISYSTQGYKTLRARVAPSREWEAGERAKLIVYGDNGAKLYESADITKDTRAFDIEVDISGYQAIKIKAQEFDQDGSEILLKDARFE